LSQPNFPIGTIELWQGSIASIPSGWFLCDGTNGTPDLRNNFVVGAGDSFAPGDSAGTITHTHDFTSDVHSHVVPAPDDLVSAGTDFSSDSANAVATGTTDTKSHLPTFYSLAYIMRLS
jgi:microcystin-dependent protein